MNREQETNWEVEVEGILKSIEIAEADFRRSGATSSIHARVLDALRDRWSECKEPVMEERAFQIDFVGRSFARQGKIELAIEVDTWHKPLGNWVKLLDVTATAKMWIYVCREKDRANERLQGALREFRTLARYRGEDETNNVVIFMKVAGEAGVRKHHLFEEASGGK